MTRLSPGTAPAGSVGASDPVGVLDTLVVPVALVALAVVSGGVIEFEVGGDTIGANTAQLAALAIAVLASVRVWRRRQLRVDVLVLVIAALALVPMAQGLVRGEGPLSTGGVGRLVTVAVLLVALPQFSASPLRWRGSTVRWDVPLIAMGVALALMTLWKVIPALTDPTLGFYDLKDVVQLPLGNHNYVAAILGASLAITLVRPLGRTWWTVAAAVIALGLVLTLSRGSWVAAAVVLVVLAATRRDRATVATVAGLGTVALALLVVVVVAGGGSTDRLTGVLSPATAARMELWGASWQAFVAHPVLGVGMDRLPEWMTEVRQPYVHAHNLVLQSLSTTGVVGALIYLTYWAGAGLRAFGLPGLESRLLVGLPLLALFVHAQIDSLSYFLVFEVVVATLLGVAAAHPGAALVREVRLPGATPTHGSPGEPQ